MKILFLTFALVLGASSHASAQALTDPGLELLREQQRTHQIQHLRTSPVGVDINAPDRTTSSSPYCFDIARIFIDGAVSSLDEILAFAVQPFRDRCLGQKEIEELVQVVKQQHLTRGFITTQVFVPEHDIRTGDLHVQVVQGRVQKLVYGVLRDGKAPVLAPLGKVLTAFPGVVEQTLQLRDLEQGVAQINRVASSSATIDILPGEIAGTSIVKVVERQQRSWRLSSGFDTNGQRATGHLRIRTNLDADNLLNINDAWSANFAGARSSNAVAAAMSTPLGYWLLSNSLSYSQQGSVISQVADTVTESASDTVTLDRVVFRDSHLVVHANQSLNWYWSRRFINATALQQQYLGWGRSGLSIERYFDQSRASLDLGLSYGLPAISRTKDPANIAPDAARAKFTKVDGTLTLLQSLAPNWSLVHTITGQYSPVPLYLPNQISAGGWDTIRGFRDSGIAGDSGFYLRSELQFGVPLPWARATNDPKAGSGLTAIWSDLSLGGIGRQIVHAVTPYLFVDAGHIRANGPKTSSRLASVGLGLRSAGDRVKFDVAIAAPLVASVGHPSAMETTMTMNVQLW